MNHAHQHNLLLLMQRFPDIYFLYQCLHDKQIKLTHMSVFEKGWEKSDLLYVYGLCDAAKIILWLEEDKKRKLVFIEDDLRYVNGFLTSSQSTALLAHERVFLYYLRNKNQLEDFVFNMVKEYPVQNVSILCGRKNKSFFTILKKLILHYATWHYNWSINRLYYHHHFTNFIDNIALLKDSFLASHLEGKFKNIPAVICGAGPSLQDNKEMLKKMENRAILISGGSATALLSEMGINPHFAVAVDPNVEEYVRFKANSAFEIPLLYTTRLCNNIFSTFNGLLGYLKTDMGDSVENFLTDHMGLKKNYKDMIKKEANSVVTVSLLLAYLFGCDPIIFCGVDLAYYDDNKYNTDLFVDNGIEDDFVLKKINISKHKKTTIEWQKDGIALSNFIKDNKISKTIFNVSTKGMKIEGVPFMSFKKVFSNYLQKSCDLRSLIYAEISECSRGQLWYKDLDNLVFKRLLNSFKRCQKLTYTILESIHEEDASCIPSYLALEEMKLQKEPAFRYFLYDLHFYLDHLIGKDVKGNGFQKRWEYFKDIVDIYVDSLKKHSTNLKATNSRF